MVTIGLLRRFPFFGGFEPDHLKALAMLTDEVALEEGSTLFRAGQPADRFYLLMEGRVELHYIAVDPLGSEPRRAYFIGEFNAGEPFGVTALLEPYAYMGDLRVATRSRVLRMDAPGLRALCELDPTFAAIMMRKAAKASMVRLIDARGQLAAARASMMGSSPAPGVRG
jgi:CRP-like cAMP-binding protein